MSAPETPGPATPEAAPPRPRVPLWMRLLLALSLAANLLVLGIVGGAALSHRDRASLPRDAASALYLRALPHDHREMFETHMRHEAAALRASRQALRAELEATLALLRAEAFDPAAFAGRIATQRGRLAERTALGDRLFVDRLAAMSPGERRAYADRLEQALRRAWRGRG